MIQILFLVYHIGSQQLSVDSRLGSALNSVMTARRRHYPPPWKFKENRKSYVVTDATGQKLAYIYFANKRRRQKSPRTISRDDAYQLTRIIMRIPLMLLRE